MSKYFGWLKKNKQQNEPQQDSQAEQSNEPLSPIPQQDTPIVHSDSSNEAISEQQSTAEIVIAPEPAITAEAPKDSVQTKTVEPSETFVEEEKPTNDKIIAADAPIENSTDEETPAPDEQGFFSRLKRGLSRTKENLGSGFANLFRGKSIDEELFEELETQLLVSDVGVDTTSKIIKDLTESADKKQLKDGDALYQLLKQKMADILDEVDSPLTLKTESGPFVILMVGVNGVGKTTTIGKMAKQFQQQGKKVMLAAGDTFRAAAVEQLQVWGDRNNIPVVAQQTGSDSASVVFDAYQSARARNIDVLIADTAGRLQNKEHLMEELKKVVRVIKKISPDAPHEIMLTLDAGTGQNAISQTKLFNEAVGLTGISLTKLDGTARGGVIFSIADQFDIPIRYIGIGEGIDDLRPFNSHDFVDALFAESQQTTAKA
jgi:fused signal recognition particle receptor